MEVSILVIRQRNFAIQLTLVRWASVKDVATRLTVVKECLRVMSTKSTLLATEYELDVFDAFFKNRMDASRLISNHFGNIFGNVRNIA